MFEIVLDLALDAVLLLTSLYTAFTVGKIVGMVQGDKK